MDDGAGRGRIIVVFRVRVKSGMEAEYERRLADIYELASKSPGLLSLRDYEQQSSGEKAYIIEWDSDESLKRWRDHPLHQEAMKIGRERLYSWYKVQVCEEFRTMGSDAPVASESPATNRNT